MIRQSSSLALVIALLACCRFPASTPAGAQEIQDPKSSDQDDAKQKQMLIGNLRYESMQGYGRPASQLLGMLNAKAVDRDLRANQLEITEEQTQRILDAANLAQRLRLRMFSQAVQAVELDEPARSLKLKEYERLRKKVLNDVDQVVLKGILTPGQAQRLQQIRWQSYPIPSVLEDPELGRLLDLTEKQKREIEARWKTAQHTINNPPQELRALQSLRKSSDDPAVNQQIDAANVNFSKQNLDSVLAALNASQMERYRRLMGPRWAGAR